MQEFPKIPSEWRNDSLATKWELIRRIRRVITGAIEVERAEKRIGSSLETAPVIYASAKYIEAIEGLDLAEIAIISNVEIINSDPPDEAFTMDEIPGIGVIPVMAKGKKCVRCYKILPEVGSIPDHDEVCIRCADAADHFTATI